MMRYNRARSGALVVALALTLPVWADTQPAVEPKAEDTKKTLEEAKKEMAKLREENARLKQETLAREEEKQVLKARLAKMEAQLQLVTRELIRLKALQKAGALPAAGNPPKENVEGVVTEVTGKLIRLSVGADAGLAKGQTLEAFRLGATPKYLGQVRITEVKPKEATGQVVGRAVELRKGDRVASRMPAR